MTDVTHKETEAAALAALQKPVPVLVNKYLREFPCAGDPTRIDVYSVLEAFKVNCPGLQHAVKKLLCTGIRGHKDTMQDLLEARQALDRAIEIQAWRDTNKGHETDGDY